jgi:hypothetical protein
MNIFTSSRIAKVVAIILFLLAGISTAQHPKGKWYPAQTLPGLGSSQQQPQLIFADSLLGYYIGQDSGFVTQDGGQYWKMIDFGPTVRCAPSFLFTPDHNTIIAYQKYGQDTDGTAFPAIIESTDMGNSWFVVSTNSYPPSGSNVKAFTMWTAKDGFRIWLNDITGKDSAAVTHDGGITWNDPRTDATLKKYTSKLKQPGASVNITSAWSDSLHGAISVQALSGGSTTPYPVIATSDGGKTWTESYPTVNGVNTFQHSFVYLYPGSQTIWTIPSVPNTAEYVFYTTNFGSSWNNTPQFKRGDLGVGNGTKPGVIQLASISPTETWALLATDTDHPDLTRFIAYDNLSTGWEKDTVITLKGAGFFGLKLISILFTDRNHGWATAIQTYFDNGAKTQVTKDSLFIYSFRTSPPVTGDVKPNARNSNLLCVPNPASSLVKITGLAENEMIRDVKIINTLGKESTSLIRSSGSEVELDLSSFPCGCYYITVNTSLRKESIPVMVVR